MSSLTNIFICRDKQDMEYGNIAHTKKDSSKVTFGKQILEGFLTSFPWGFENSTFADTKSSRICANGNPHFLGYLGLALPHRIWKSSVLRIYTPIPTFLTNSHQYRCEILSSTILNEESVTYYKMFKSMPNFFSN